MAVKAPDAEFDGQVSGAEKISAALAYLYQASQYSRETDRDVWDFAVEIGVLEGFGLSVNDLRRLVSKGYVKQATEHSLAGDACRTFGPEGDLYFSERTCFVLTESGVRFAQSILPRTTASVEQAAPTIGHSSDVPASIGRAVPPIPHWDVRLRELRLGGRLVKRFHVPSPNQEMILAAFQEESWPDLLDDPLPPQPGQNSKRRVHDTIKNLNRHQETRLLYFYGDGTGKGIRWKFLSDKATRTAE